MTATYGGKTCIAGILWVGEGVALCLRNGNVSNLSGELFTRNMHPDTF